MMVLRSQEIRKDQNNLKTSLNYNLVPSLPPPQNILSMLAKDSLKTQYSFFRSALFHMKTEVCLKYFLRGCRTTNKCNKCSS